MTDTRTQTDVTADPPHPYTPAALARLMLSDAYREVAATSLGRIGTEDDYSSTVAPGDFVREAASLIRLAESVQRRAAIYERERGTSWEEIGEALGITRQSAHAKFANHEKAWRAPLDKPERQHADGTPDDPRIPYGARYAPGSAVPVNGSADKTAHLLDQWLRRHSDTGDGAEKEHPVSGGLPRHDTLEMTLLISHALHEMRKDELLTDPQTQADLLDRLADLYERIIRESTAVEAQAPMFAIIPQRIAADRARAAALRAYARTGEGDRP